MAESECPDPVQTRPRSCANAVFLVGFMGAGKTTVGRELAGRLRWSFIDLDDRVEAAQGCSVAELFAKAGEKVFREAEAKALAEVLSELGSGLKAIVALGGGAFVQPGNANLIRATGVPVVFLDAPVEELRRRCAPKGASRPLFQDDAAFAKLYTDRRSSYMRADIRVNTGAKSVSAVALEILTFLGVSDS